MATKEQCDFFHENGYLSLDQLASSEEVAALKSLFEEMFQNKIGREQGLQFDMSGTDEEGQVARLPQIINPSKLQPQLRKSVFHQKAHAIAREILGPEAEFVFDHALLKPAFYGDPTPWHQDEAFSDPAWELDHVSFWMPLQPATVGNGCLKFVPKSHRGGILPHRPFKNDPKIHALECYDGFNPEDAVACPLPAGGVTLHGSRTLHGAGPNNTDQARLAYVVVFGNPAKRAAEPREFPWLQVQKTARQERESRWTESQGRWKAASQRLGGYYDKVKRRLRRLTTSRTLHSSSHKPHTV